MSWNFQIPASPQHSFSRACWDALDQAKEQERFGTEASREMRAQAEMAVEAAIALADSGVVGDGLISASLSGHANPGHEPRAGWADDMIQITVYQRPTPPATPG